MTCRAFVTIVPNDQVEALCRDCGESKSFDPKPIVRGASYQAALEWTRAHNLERRSG